MLVPLCVCVIVHFVEKLDSETGNGLTNGLISHAGVGIAEPLGRMWRPTVQQGVHAIVR